MTVNQTRYYKKINVQDFVGEGQNNGFDLKPFLKLLWMNRWALLMACIASALIGIHMSSKQTPIYKST